MTQADSVHSTPPINTSANNVKSQQKALARQAAQRQRALKRIRKLRVKAADEIDRLLEFIDTVDDTDVDSQCDDNPCDEDELDGPENGEDEESEPDEPSLGSVGPNEYNDQERWASGNRQDLEDEHDGAEPDEDGEPALGAFEGHVDQDIAWNCNTYSPDNELDGAESGIGDQDGLDEQVPFRDWQNVGMV